jgi:hypothetical protein
MRYLLNHHNPSEMQTPERFSLLNLLLRTGAQLGYLDMDLRPNAKE